MSLRPTHISPTKTRSQPGSKLWRLGRRGRWDPDFVRHILLLMLKPDSQGPQMQMNAFRCLLKSCARLYFFLGGEGYTHSYQPPQGEAESLRKSFPQWLFPPRAACADGAPAPWTEATQAVVSMGMYHQYPNCRNDRPTKGPATGKTSGTFTPSHSLQHRKAVSTDSKL